MSDEEIKVMLERTSINWVEHTINTKKLQLHGKTWGSPLSEVIHARRFWHNQDMQHFSFWWILSLADGY